MATILDAVKTTLRKNGIDAFDNEINDLIAAAQMDLTLAGIANTDTDDPLVRRAVETYCRLNFGSPDDYARLKTSYDEQKAQLSMATGFTDWGRA